MSPADAFLTERNVMRDFTLAYFVEDRRKRAVARRGVMSGTDSGLLPDEFTQAVFSSHFTDVDVATGIHRNRMGSIGFARGDTAVLPR